MKTTQLALSASLTALMSLFSQAAEAQGTSNTPSSCGINVPNCVILPPPPPPSCGTRPCGSPPPAPTPPPASNTNNNTNNNTNHNTNHNSANAVAHAAAQAAAHSNAAINLASGAVAGGTSTSNSTIQTGAVQNTVTGGSVAAGAVQNHVAGSTATIQSGALQSTNNVTGGSVAAGAVQNTNNVAGGSVAAGAVRNDVTATGGLGGAGGSSVIQTGAVAPVISPTTTSSASIAPGAVVASPTATIASDAVKNTATNEGNTVNINNPVARQATHMNVANAPGNVSGCVAQSGFSITLSAVGAGALGTSFTTGAKMVDGCNQGEMSKAIVAHGIASDDPAKIVLAVEVAGHTKALDAVTDERMNKFGKQNRAVVQQTQAPAPQGNIALNQHFYGEKTTAGQQTNFVCNYVDKKTGAVVPGEIITVQGKPVCKTGGDAAPAMK